MSGALVVFAKRPEPGQVKTRLCPPLTPEQAAAFYACMLEDVLETSVRAAAALDLEAVLAVHPPEAAETLPAPAGLRREPQHGADLGERMEHALARELAAGRSPVLLRGSDSPTLGLATLRAALDALTRADLVICPDRDGGYNLVGLARPAPGLFSHPMSTGSVLADTLTRARLCGLSHALLPAGFDIDSAADLGLLAEARSRGAAGACPHSVAFLDRHGLWPDGAATASQAGLRRS
jgi:rSAM/selenodomain-associated transferase 1